jgi:hypothetical protein
MIFFDSYEFQYISSLGVELISFFLKYPTKMHSLFTGSGEKDFLF